MGFYHLNLFIQRVETESEIRFSRPALEKLDNSEKI